MRKLFALTLALLPSLALAAEPTPRTITTTGNADVRVAPDEIEISLGIETKDKNLGQAKRANDERLHKVMGVLRNLKIEPKHIQTDYVSIEPDYNSDRDRTLVGYWVRRNIAVILKDTSKFDAVMAQTLEAGINHVHSVQLRTTELRKHRDRARTMAIRAAREKAVALAGELGQKVGKARTIHEGGSYWRGGSSWGGGRWGGQSQNVSQNNEGGPSESAGSTLGQIAISATVSVVFDLE
jgi:uncharacterized protein YggE